MRRGTGEQGGRGEGEGAGGRVGGKGGRGAGGRRAESKDVCGAKESGAFR